MATCILHCRDNNEGRRLLQVLHREVARFTDDHLSADPDAKWPLLTVARLKEAQARLGLCDGDSAALLAEVKSMYERLAVIDPSRKGFYLDAADGKAGMLLHALGTTANLDSGTAST